ncbi:MAG TPA: hypothetical protein VI454_20215 [Verrucomicrobiae bacterium]|jgi:hypothetical protein
MKKNGTHAKNGKHKATPAFVARAERALRRAARNVKAENRLRGLQLIVWKGGKTVEIPGR